MGDLVATGIRLGEFWPALRALSREAFLAEYPHPFLLELTEGGSRPAADFHTVHDLTRSKLEAGGDPDDAVTAQSRIFAVRKFTAVMTGKVTVGRSKNNDVVVLDARVSKFHAYFAAAGEAWTLVDAESSNGTYHNAVRLPSFGRVPLTNRDQVGFGGNARFVFVDAAHFHRQARFLLQGGDA